MQCLKKVIFLTAVPLVGLTMLVFAQNVTRSPVMKRSQEAALKQGMLSSWAENDKNSTVLSLLWDGVGEEFGISEEQRQRIMDRNTLNINEMGYFYAETPGGPFDENATEETQKKYLDLQTEIQNRHKKDLEEVVNGTLSSDQLRKIRELQIATMSGDSFVSPDMFEALNMSDDQKKQLEGIKRELKPEYEKNVDKWVAFVMLRQEKMAEEIGNKLDGIMDPVERNKISMEASKKIVEQYPEFSRGIQEIKESGKIFSNKLKFRMFDVLTDEQMERMAQLIDNPPDYVRKVLAQRRKAMGYVDNETGEWKPGPDSWKPGDGIPAEYLKQREERRFPRRP